MSIQTEDERLELRKTETNSVSRDIDGSRAVRSPAALFIMRMKSEESRRTMRSSLRLLAVKLSGGGADELTFPWHRLGYAETQATRAWLMSKYASTTANKHLAALRGVLREAWRLGLMSEEEYRRTTDVQAARIERPLSGRMLSREETARLFAAAAALPSPRRERDSALLALCSCLGLRRFEVAGLKLGDVNLETGEVRAHGKGEKERVLFLPPRGLALVSKWVETRGNWPGPLLTPFAKTGAPLTSALSTAGVEFILKELGAAAGLQTFTPHDLRRTFVSELLGGGVDLVTVQRLAGHSRPETTARYDRRGDEAKRSAVALLDVPASE